MRRKQKEMNELLVEMLTEARKIKPLSASEIAVASAITEGTLSRAQSKACAPKTFFAVARGLRKKTGARFELQVVRVDS